MVELVDFDIQKYLKNPEFAAEYLNGIIEDGDQEELHAALGELVRAYGTADMATAANISQDSVCLASNPGASLTVATMRSILAIVGLQLVVVPATKSA